MKKIFWKIEDLKWNMKCRYNFWLHGPYGLAKVVEQMPFRFIIKYLRKYGATIGENCRFERGINIHRPLGKKPFENLFIGNNVYFGHSFLIDLSRRVIIYDDVIIASRCQIWTHTSVYEKSQENKFHYRENFGEVIIDKGAIIYSSVIIIYGIKIGRFSIVGANSLLNKTVLDNQFWSGVPAKYIKDL